MPSHAYAVVRIGPDKARIIRFSRKMIEEKTIHPENETNDIPVIAKDRSHARAVDKQAYYQNVTDALDDVETLFVAGPGDAKSEFIEYLHRYAPELEKRIAHVEMMGHAA